MTKEEYNLIYRFARKYLFRKYHSQHLDDLTQYLCINKWKKPNYDLRYGVIDYCREAGLTINHSRVKNRVLTLALEIQDFDAIAAESTDIYGVIEEQLILRGFPQLKINEIMTLLMDKDYSSIPDHFRRIGLELPVKYKYQRWDNSEKMCKLAHKIIKYLRENYDREN